MSPRLFGRLGEDVGFLSRLSRPRHARPARPRRPRARRGRPRLLRPPSRAAQPPSSPAAPDAARPGGADKKLDTPVSGLESACTRWRPGSSPWRPSRRVQPDRGGRAGRLQPHGRCKLGEGGGRRPAAPQEGRILALRQEDGARRAAGGRGAGRRPRRRGRRHRRCRLRLAPAAPRGRGALPHDRLGHRRPRAGAPRGALGARGAQGPLRGAGAAQRRPRGDDRHTKKRPRRRPVRPDGGGEGGAG